MSSFKKNKINGLSLLLMLSLLLINNQTFSQSHYLQVGQSQTIKLPENVNTVFITKEAVANYEIIGDRSLIIYAKKNGITSLIAYDENDNIILNDIINVDPVLSQISYRLKQDFPNSNITIDKYQTGDTGELGVYVIRGTTPDTVTKDRILDFIGVMIGTNETKSEYSVDGGDNSFQMDFMTKRSYSNIVDQIEVTQESQINVKLTFVEVNKEFADALGIEWQSLTLNSMVGGSDIKSNSMGEFSLLGLKKGFDIGNITTIIRAIKSDKLGKVLAEPNLSVLSGETASFLVGGEIPVVVSGTNNGDSNTVDYKEYGIKLNIGAKLNNNKRIRLVVANEFSSISDRYTFNNYSIPILSTRKTSSTIDLADGDSFVIAGLISEQDIESLQKIPFLGDIPILGALARSASTTRLKTELVVFATVKLVTPKNSFNNVELPVLQRTDATNIFFNIKNNMNKYRNNEFPRTNEGEKFIDSMGFVE